MAAHSTERILGEDVQEVRGTDEGLLKQIAEGTVEKPPLSQYLDWISWRRSSETRPNKEVDVRTSTPKEEADLWRGAMAALYGAEWRLRLAEQEEAAVVAALEAAGEESGMETPGRMRGPQAVGPSGAPAAGAGPEPGALALAPPKSPVREIGSGGSSGQATPTGLRQVIEQEFDPARESKDQWQQKVLRGVAQLERLGHALKEEDIEKIIVKGSYAEEIGGKDLKGQVQYLKAAFAEVLLAEGTYEESEYDARLAGLMEMLRARGTQPSSSMSRLFSSAVTGVRSSWEPSPVKTEAAPKGAGVGPVNLATPPPEKAEVRALREEFDRLRQDMVTRTPGAGSQAESAEGALAQAINVQTEAIRAALRSKDQKHSVVKITPTFRWPILGDDGPDAKEVEEFYEKYEDLCRLANDGRGMNPTEHLTTLVSCLRGSKEKIYRLVYKKHRKLGTVEEDPDKVFEEIRNRHMKFVETPMEKQMRLTNEWDTLWKGSSSGHQFEALFEEAVTELELAGLAKNQRELLLGYLQKVGPQWAAEIQKDVRSWTSADGETSVRRVATWEEAHKILVELEGVRAGGKALQSNYSYGGKDPPSGKGRGQGKGGKQDGGGQGSAAPCWDMLKSGTCHRGNDCRFSHDSRVLADAKAKKGNSKGGGVAASSPPPNNDVYAGGKAGKKGGKKGDKKGKGKGGGKEAGSKTGSPPTKGVSRVQFPDKVCWEQLRSKSCSKGKECRFSHDLGRFDDQGRLKPPKVAGATGGRQQQQQHQGEDQAGPVGLQAGKGGGQAAGAVGQVLVNPFLGPLTAARPASQMVARTAPPKARAEGDYIGTLQDLPRHWWVEVPNDYGGYQMITELWLGDRKVATLLDYGAAVNAIPEEVVIKCINDAHRRRIRTDDAKYPIIQLERFPEQETVNGIRAGEPVRIVGSVVMRLGLEQPRPGRDKEAAVRFKIFEKGTSDWPGIILGGRALDTPNRGGLGLRVTDTHYVFETEGVVLPRVEEERMPRRDWVYAFRSTCGPPRVGALGAPAAGAVHYATSVVDSDDEEVGTSAAGGRSAGSAHAAGQPSQEGGDRLLYEGDRVDLEPGDGAWVPVRRERRHGKRSDEGRAEVVLQSQEGPTDVAPGLWSTGQDEGLVFVANTTAFDQVVEDGAAVAVVAPAAVQTRVCQACGAEDTEAWPEEPGAPRCTTCGGLRPGGASSCRQCGAGPERSKVLGYAGCQECSCPAEPAPTNQETPLCEERECATAPALEEPKRPPKGPRRVPRRRAYGFAGRFLWTVGAVGAAVLGNTARNVAKLPVFHIVEQPGAIERMAEVEVPTEYYYDKLREDMGSRYPDASRHVLDHLLSLEAFLDVSILSGFSFGVDKADVLRAEGKLLGRLVSRSGIKGDGERAQAVRDFAPLKEKVHVQQFAGSTNWLRQHMKEPYAQALKVLGEYMKPGAVFPPAGLGVGNTPGDLAVKAIKLMAMDMIELAVMDEAAAIDGSRPLEQIADSSGIAWGGTCLQMTKDLAGFNVLMTASKGLTPAQQAWPPLTLEGYAQLETKRAQRRTLGSMRSLCWTDHANWTKQLVLEDIDVKHLRWVSWIIADGSQIRSLSGRTAKLGDGFSRNPLDRDALIEQRTKDLAGRTGQLRGFSLEGFLADYEEGRQAYPWTLVSDAVPDKGLKEDTRGEVAVSAFGPSVPHAVVDRVGQIAEAAGVQQELLVLYAGDAETDQEGEKGRKALEEEWRKLLPSRWVNVRWVGGPFHDEATQVHAHFDKGKKGLPPQKLILETKRDGLTAVVGLARHVARIRPDVVLGRGQGGVVAGAFAKPGLLEVALQARNVQREEAGPIAEAWGRLQGVWVVSPRLGRAVVGSDLLKQAFPEMFDLGYPKEGPRLYALLPATAALHDELQKLLGTWGATVCRRWADVDWDELLARKGLEIWDHEGICGCGRKTYLFGQCARCLKEEAAERHEAVLEEAGSEEGPVVAGGWLPETAPTEALGRVAGPETKSLHFLTAKLVTVAAEQVTQERVWVEDVLKRDSPIKVWAQTWKGGALTLPNEGSGGGPFRISFVQTAVGTILPAQQCVRTKYEECHELSYAAWPRSWGSLGDGTKWPEMQALLDQVVAGKAPAGQHHVQHLFGIGGNVVSHGVGTKKVKETGHVAFVKTKGVWKHAAKEGKVHGSEERVFLELGPMPERPWKLVCFSSAKWMFYDLGGVLSRVAKPLEPHPLAGQGTRGLPAASTFGSPAAGAAYKLRQVPWQTPHTFDEKGELRLSEHAKRWFAEALKKRASLRDEARAEAGDSDFEVTSGVRSRLLLSQKADNKVQELAAKEGFRANEADGVVETRVPGRIEGQEIWVPVVPEGAAAGHISWKRWVFLQAHVGVFGGHRLANQTVRILRRLVWWSGMKSDVEGWVEDCLTCARFRKRPTKQDAVAVKPRDLECWQEVMIDMEGPSNPADKLGNKYVMTYICCLCHGVFLEPCRNLTGTEVRRAFGRCIFRSGTLPAMIRSDRGVEFKNALMHEYVALLGARHKFGMAWRPMEQGIVERSHQELQKILGMLVTDVIRSYSTEWTELLVVVEFLVYTTPGAHGYAPRDLDRRWSLAMPLEKELQPLELNEFEPVSGYAKEAFKAYGELRAKVTGWHAATSDKRAELANRWRKTKVLSKGDRVIYRDPRAKAVGGRTPWKEPLSDPCVVEEVYGNRAKLRREDGTEVPEAHLEDIVVVPGTAKLLERDALDLEAPEPVEENRSLGQMIEAPDPPEQAQKGKGKGRGLGKLDKLAVGLYVAYDPAVGKKTCRVGRITAIMKAEAEVAVHKHRAVSDCRLRVKWVPLFWSAPDEGGEEQAGQGTRPSIDNVGVKRVLSVIQLHDGVMGHAVARRLDRAGWTLEAPERVSLLAGPTEGTGAKLEELVSGARLSLTVAASGARAASARVLEFATEVDLQRWLGKGTVDFLEIYCGYGQLTARVSETGLVVGEGIDNRVVSYGRKWPLDEPEARSSLAWLIVEGLKPRATHTGTPCTHMCIIGKREDTEATPELAELSRQIAEHQDAHGQLASNENPVGSGLHRREGWSKSFGEPEAPKAPWKYVRSTGCQWALVCPGDRTCGSNTDGMEVLGRPIQKHQLWMANFDLSPLGRGCRDPPALAGCSHTHQHARGNMKMPDGKWASIATYTGKYTPELSTVYGRCLARGLLGVSREAASKETELSKLAGLVPRQAAREDLRASGSRRGSTEVKVISGGYAFPIEGRPGIEEVHKFTKEETPAEQKERKEALDKEAASAEELWRQRADKKDWDQVRHSLEVYAHAGAKVEEDPRRAEDYRQRVVEGLGFGEGASEKHPELNEQERAAATEVLKRKAAAFWLEGSPRTTVRFVEHDTVPTGPPVKVPPHNLKGEAAEWVDNKLQEEVARGQLERGTSAWGSPPFPTKEFPEHRKQRKRRIVVDYRRVNARTLRSVYFVRNAAGVVAEAAGSIWLTLLDAVTGFNHIVNTERARKMLAILARSGQFLPRCLTFGPHNGPEDFCYVIDRFYSPGRRAKRRFCKEWLAYVDDLTVRTGRVLDGVHYSDAEHEERLAAAAARADQTAYQDAQEALEAQGFLAKGLGSELKKGSSKKVLSKPTPTKPMLNHGSQYGRLGMMMTVWGASLSLAECSRVGGSSGSQAVVATHAGVVEAAACVPRGRSSGSSVVAWCGAFAPSPPIRAVRRPAFGTREPARPTAGEEKTAMPGPPGSRRSSSAASSSSGGIPPPRDVPTPPWRPPALAGGRTRLPDQPLLPTRPAPASSARWERRSEGGWQEDKGKGKGKTRNRLQDRHFVRKAGKALVTLLRHDPDVEVRHLMDTAGWVRVDDLLATRTMRGFRLGSAEALELVDIENRGKIRFTRSFADDGAPMLRAAQGHSKGVSNRLAMEEVLTEVSPGHPKWQGRVFHGAKEEAWPNIVLEGLSTKYSKGRSGEKRTHIHLVRGPGGEEEGMPRPGGRGGPRAPGPGRGRKEVPGLRSGSTVMITVDLDGAHAAGARVFLSDNEVFLTEGFGGTLPPQFVVEVTSLRDGAVLWPAPVEAGVAAAVSKKQGVALQEAKLATSMAALDADPEWPLEACWPAGRQTAVDRFLAAESSSEDEHGPKQAGIAWLVDRGLGVCGGTAPEDPKLTADQVSQGLAVDRDEAIADLLEHTSQFPEEILGIEREFFAINLEASSSEAESDKSVPVWPAQQGAASDAESLGSTDPEMPEMEPAEVAPHKEASEAGGKKRVPPTGEHPGLRRPLKAKTPPWKLPPYVQAEERDDEGPSPYTEEDVGDDVPEGPAPSKLIILKRPAARKRSPAPWHKPSETKRAEEEDIMEISSESGDDIGGALWAGDAALLAEEEGDARGLPAASAFEPPAAGAAESAGPAPAAEASVQPPPPPHPPPGWVPPARGEEEPDWDPDEGASPPPRSPPPQAEQEEESDGEDPTPYDQWICGSGCGLVLGKAWARNCKWCGSRCHLTCLLSCSTDECGWTYCKWCEPLHTHSRNKVSGPVGWQSRDEWKRAYDARRVQVLQEQARAGEAELSAESRRQVAEGRQSEADLSTAARGRSVETPLTRFVERLAAGSLLEKTQQARALAAATGAAGDERSEQQAHQHARVLAELKEQRQREHSLSMEKLEALRDRIRLKRLWREEGEGGQNGRRRSVRFLQLVKAIHEGRSQETIWQALRRERKYQAQKRLDLELRMRRAAAGDRTPLEDPDVVVWPEGTWECELCLQKNFPSVEHCTGTVRPSSGEPYRCQGTFTENWGRWVTRPNLKAAHLANRPPSHVYRHAYRSKEAIARQRKAGERHRGERAREAEVTGGGWWCPRCESSNFLGRMKCRVCSYERDKWFRDVWHEGDPTGGEDETLATFQRKKQKKRGGAKHKKTRKKRKLRVRRSTAGEQAQAGRTRAAGSGVFKSPIAHLAQVARTAATALLALAGAEVWQLLRVARTQAEGVLVAAGELATTALLEAAGLAEGAGGVGRRALEEMAAFLKQVGSTARWLVPCLAATAATLGATCAWLRWRRVAKAMMAATGQNPEANLATREAPLSALDRAQSIFERLQSPVRIPWLTEELALEFVRNKKGARQLVKKVVRLGGRKFKVGSETTRGDYEVEVDLADLGPRSTATMVLGCNCMDHLKLGPVCKHAGAVLLSLAGGEAMPPEKQEESKGTRGLSAARTFWPPARDAVLALADAASSARGSGDPAPGSNGQKPTVEDQLTAEKIKALKAKAVQLQEQRSSKGAPKEKEVPRTSVGYSTSTADQVRGGESQEADPARMGTVRAVLDAVGSQEAGIRLIREAKSYVLLTAFTYDRPDVTDALVEARRRNVEVRIGVDRKSTLQGTTRDQLQRLKEIAAHGAEVRVCSGRSYSDEYRAVGRAPVGGVGLQHSKVVLTEQTAMIGSCNWTTASRANHEVGLLVVLNAEEHERLKARLCKLISEGEPLASAEILAEQRTRSASPTRRSRRSG